MKSNIFPVEIWQLIFSLACTDDGSTGRSLSLVSTHFRDISAPFKYQSIAITHWSKIIAFSQFFFKLPSDIHDKSALPECNDGDDLIASDCDSESTSGSDDSRDLEFEGSFDDDEEREILEDVEYLEAVRDGRLPHELDEGLRDDSIRDSEILDFFYNVLQAFRAVLREISSTLRILAVYWRSFNPLQIHQLLPPLPRLVELHIDRSSIFEGEYYHCVNPPTTTLLPELLSLYISGQNPRRTSFGDDLARIAPNLTSLRFSLSHFYP